jgi:hypothetical protein
MAVVTMMRFAGDPDELWAKVRDRVDPVTTRLSREHGRIANVVARTDDGIVVINLWETEEGRQAMAEEPEVQQAVGAAGLPRPDVEVLEVLARHVDGAAG